METSIRIIENDQIVRILCDDETILVALWEDGFLSVALVGADDRLGTIDDWQDAYPELNELVHDVVDCLITL